MGTAVRWIQTGTKVLIVVKATYGCLHWIGEHLL